MENKEAKSPRSPGRPRSIDRDLLLDAAEAIVIAQGAGALTIDAVAKAMGITKGGVQYAFGSKDALIEAMTERWNRSYEELFAALAGPAPGPRARVAAHAEATRQSDLASSAKAATLLAALVRTQEHLETTRRWYRQRIVGLDPADPADRRARLAFLATEGAFMLRFFGLMEMDEREWDAVFADIAALVAPPAAD